MKFYIDFEATQPEQEIIAIGAVAENGATFHSLVKPQLAPISDYISQMTHISRADLDMAKTIDDVMIDFDMWAMEQESNIMHCRFISYGDDAQFIKATLPVVKDEHAFTCMACMLAKMEDCSKEMFKFFHGTISLVHAFNYVQSIEIEQKHNPLEDAMMLQKVYEHTQINEPLPCHPLNKNFGAIVDSANMKMPSGTFFCRTSMKKSAQIRSFETCDEAIEWLITKVMKVPNPECVHRDRIMANIMKAIRKKEKYCNFFWDRVKEEKVETAAVAEPDTCDGAES